MDTKNIVAAISLSAAVIILYSLFFAPTTDQIKRSQNNNLGEIQSSETPLLEDQEKSDSISREDAILLTQRVKFENTNIKGSISLVGGVIDDLVFKNYTSTLNGKDNIILLNPKKISDGYYVDTGWVTNDKNIDLPDTKSIWKVKGNNILSPKNPITLFWQNNQGIKFEKEIKIDEKFLFTINQKIINSSNKIYTFYPYGQIIRNKSPEVTNFYILHEGLIGVLDDN